jgi:hypothetical protein
MNQRKELTEYLQSEPRARERTNKDRAIVNLLVAHNPTLKTIDKNVLVDLVKDHNSMDRMWRKILEERPDLRGADYWDKEILEQKKILNLGYEVGYSRDKKLLDKLN